MYPDFQYFFQDVFNTDMPAWLSIFKVFGFMVALAFLGALITLIQELKRKEKQGLLQPEIELITVGKAPTTNDIVFPAIFGFIVLFKIGGLFSNASTAALDPMGFIFSLNGDFVLGIIGAAVFGYYRYYELKKQQLPKPETRKLTIHPHDRVSTILAIAAISGLAGAKIFNAFETWDDFIQHPIQNLVSSSGLTFYGGLITATAALYFYAKKHKIPFAILCDAAAPGLMLAYGVGRLGCHFAGDGDWGIFNSAYISDASGHLKAAAAGEYQQMVQQASSFFMQYTHAENIAELAKVPHAYVPAPSWLPDWALGMNYAHNVNNEGVAIAGCSGNYCSVLPVSVFPTALYEAITCIGLFSLLWSLRKRLGKPLQLFGVYLILNGLERFFVEKIRVNYKYDWGFIHPTQAEIISTCLIVSGVVILLFYKGKTQVVAPVGDTSS